MSFWKRRQGSARRESAGRTKAAEAIVMKKATTDGSNSSISNADFTIEVRRLF